ncbi:MAG: WD40 repeat domain-containing protein [Myxococcaceae bacterium]|nr:MAG: WD40 repeat domain-containing protein [Myxococcaceae bacterium]
MSWVRIAVLCLLGMQLTACDPEPLPDSDCVDGTTEASACGLNDRGAQHRTCAVGQWSDLSACEDPDVCVDGSEESLACGFNGRGIGTRTCSSGAWGKPRCEDKDQCRDGDVETLRCGVIATQSRECASGRWGPLGFCDDPASLSLQVPGRQDLVHDARRKRLYITTREGGGGQMRAFSLVTGFFDPPLLTGGSFLGMDLSPDGDALVVADGSSSATRNWIHLIDLKTGTSRRIEFELEHGEAGTFTALFISNTEVLVTSSYNGSGGVPLRKVDLATGAVTSIAGVHQNTMLTLSADGSTVAYGQSNNSSGDWGRYKVGEQSFANSTTGWFVHMAAVSRDASQYAVPTYNGLYVFNSNLASPTLLGTYAHYLPTGVVYSPVADELYLAWTGSRASIDVYSTKTLRKLRDIEPGPGLFPDFSGSAFGTGRMRVSRDGAWLFATTGTDGVVIYPTRR